MEKKGKASVSTPGSSEVPMVFTCNRRGCNESFKYRTQLARHKLKKCNKVSPQKKKKVVQLYEKKDGKYSCKKCEITYSSKHRCTVTSQSVAKSQLRNLKFVLFVIDSLIIIQI